MSFVFSMTEDALAQGIKTLPEKRQEFVKLVQQLLKAAAEYAIMQGNGRHLNNVLSALNGEMKRHVGAYMSQTGMPFAYKDGKMEYRKTRALAVLKSKGFDVKPFEREATLPEDIAEKLAWHVGGILDATSWDDERKRQAKAEKEEKNAAKSAADKAEEIKKAIQRQLDKAKKEDFSIEEVLPSSAKVTEVKQVGMILSDEMEKLVRMIEPYSTDSSSMAAIMLALSTALTQLNKKAA